MNFTKNNNEESRSSKVFVLINCIDGQTDATIDKIKKIDSVIEMQKTDGPYDIIVTLEADSNEDLKKTLMQKIRSIDTVGYTLTLRSSLDNGVLG